MTLNSSVPVRANDGLVGAFPEKAKLVVATLLVKACSVPDITGFVGVPVIVMFGFPAVIPTTEPPLPACAFSLSATDQVFAPLQVFAPDIYL
jgi:hypothetical protein